MLIFNSADVTPPLLTFWWNLYPAQIQSVTWAFYSPITKVHPESPHTSQLSTRLGDAVSAVTIFPLDFCNNFLTARLSFTAAPDYQPRTMWLKESRSGVSWPQDRSMASSSTWNKSPDLHRAFMALTSSCLSFYFLSLGAKYLTAAIWRRRDLFRLLCWKFHACMVCCSQ